MLRIDAAAPAQTAFHRLRQLSTGKTEHVAESSLSPQVQQAKWEKDLTAALQLMAVQMIEAAVIRQDALECLLQDETASLALAAAQDRSAIPPA